VPSGRKSGRVHFQKEAQTTEQKEDISIGCNEIATYTQDKEKDLIKWT
jgi:hypothetical protein